MPSRSEASWPRACDSLLHVAGLHTLRTFAQFLRQLVQTGHLLITLRQLIELLLQIAGRLSIALRQLLLDLSLQVLLGLIVGLSELLQLVFHFRHLLLELLFFFVTQLPLVQLVLQLLQFIQGRLEITLLHGLGHAIGGALLDVLERVELFL